MSLFRRFGFLKNGSSGSGFGSWKNWAAANGGLFLPFSPFSGGCEEHLGYPENGGKRPFFLQISSDLLKPPFLKPPFEVFLEKTVLTVPVSGSG